LRAMMSNAVEEDVLPSLSGQRNKGVKPSAAGY
jgi:hypothetical protein